jgi:hypothetical protein
MSVSRNAIYVIPKCGNKQPYIEVEVSTVRRIRFDKSLAGKTVTDDEIRKRFTDLPSDAKIKVFANVMK